LNWGLTLRHLALVGLQGTNMDLLSGYIKKQLLKYEQIMQWIQHCPYSPEPKKCGAQVQAPLPQDSSQKLTNKVIK
jgi:hypothetical protein